MRVETLGNATLYCADSREVLQGLSPVSAVFTDPPFGVRSEEWDAMDQYEFAKFTMSWLSKVRDLSDQLLTFCLRDDTIVKLCEMLYPRARPMIWHKPLGSQYAGSHEARVWFSYETILHCHTAETWEVAKPKFRDVADALRTAREIAGLSKGAVDMAVRGKRTGLCYRWEEAACIPTDEQIVVLKRLMPLGVGFDEALQRAIADKTDTLGKAAEKAAEKADVFIYPTVATHGHPCEKPVRLLEDLLTSVLKDAEIVLDPFMGVGSTGVACMNHGRRYIGVEIDTTYFDTACRRIDAAQSQGRLFA